MKNQDFKINEIHHCSIIISSTERSLRFYRDLLGLEENHSRHNPGYPGAWLNIGKKQIHLLELPNPDSAENRPKHSGRDRHIALTVKWIHLLEKKLEENRIPFTRSKSGRPAVFLRDPDGNGLEFIEENQMIE
ncbi:MAG: VOC family protein [Spirochaetia bacterium]|nr:VOC family protein [Spirochaetia bacterium]